jgi:signal peptidase I
LAVSEGHRQGYAQVIRLAIGVAAAAVAVVLAVFRGRLVRRYVVDGESMLRAYRPGDHLLVEGVTYRLRPPRPGEVVVVRQPGSAGRDDLKRVYAGPGATVYVRGEERTLGPDEWFVIGDNLEASSDSRSLGPVSRGDIMGRVWRRY